jgi:ubiquinone biosynthesis protein Coq4
MPSPLALVKLAVASARLVRDPDRLEEVFALADTLQQTEAIDAMLAHVRRDPQGARAVVERPRVRARLAALRALPDGTFGREVARFLDDRGLDPDALPDRPADDPRAFVRAHLYETHDLWHVATGFDTDVAGEVGLQAFYLAQLPARLAPLLLSVAMANTFLYRFDDAGPRMDAIAAGWRLGRAARPLFGVRWAELWEQPLAEVRARLAIPAGGVAIAAAA